MIKTNIHLAGVESDMSKDSTDKLSHSSVDRRNVLIMSAAGMFSSITAANTVAGQTGNQTGDDSGGGNQTNEESSTNESETNTTSDEESDGEDQTSEETTTEESETDTSGDEDTADEESSSEETSEEATEESSEETTACDGAPSMSRTSITTPSSRITSDDPAVVEANFRPEPTIPDDCTIMVDLEFSFADSGFQWGGGSDWDQAASDFVVGTFEVQPGEIRSIQGELHTQGAEAGDDVTVQADYELWFEGNVEDSRQQSGIRQTIDVEAPNPPEDSGTDESGDDEDEDSGISVDATPGFGITSALASIGGAGYVLKSKLSNKKE
jgi:hypothetical protein